MKNILFISLLLIGAKFMSAQSFYISDEPSDNYYYRCYSMKDKIQLESIYLDELKSDNPDQVNRIDLNLPITNNYYPLFPISEISNNHLIYLVYYHHSNGYTFISVDYSNFSKTSTIIDSFHIDGDYQSFYFTKPIYTGVEVTSCFSFVKNSIRSEKIALFRFSNTGILHYKAEVDNNGNSSTNYLFGLHWVNSMVALNKNRYLLTGVGGIATLVDSSINSISRFYLTYYNRETGFDLNIVKPNLIPVDSSTVICVDSGPYLGDLFNEQLNYKLKIVSDSIYIDSFLLQSNVEKTEKNNPWVTSGKGGEYYVATNEDFFALKNKFHVTKCDGLKEIWKKSFGGDYNFRVNDINYVNEDFIIIVGRIYDYYGNGIVNGFYLVLNSKGEPILASKEIDLDKIDIFPNPSNGKFTIRAGQDLFNKSKDISGIQLYNVTGTLISNDVKIMNGCIDLGEFPNGFYILRFLVNCKMQASKIQIYRP